MNQHGHQKYLKSREKWTLSDSCDTIFEAYIFLTAQAKTPNNENQKKRK